MVLKLPPSPKNNVAIDISQTAPKIQHCKGGRGMGILWKHIYTKFQIIPSKQTYKTCLSLKCLNYFCHRLSRWRIYIQVYPKHEWPHVQLYLGVFYTCHKTVHSYGVIKHNRYYICYIFIPVSVFQQTQLLQYHFLQYIDKINITKPVCIILYKYLVHQICYDNSLVYLQCAFLLCIVKK